MTIKKDRASAARAALAAKRAAQKAPPDWEGEPDGDRFAKFRGKSETRWQDFSHEDRLSIPAEVLADLARQGLDIEWVAEKVCGQEQTYALSQHTRNGWVRVEQEDGLIDGPVAVDDLRLYCRPLAISRKAAEHERRKAAAVVATKRESLMGGVLPGVTLDSKHVTAVRSNRINRTIERIDLSVPGEGE